MSNGQADLRLVILGSIGIDTIETPFERRADILGGSVTYACAASSRFARTGMVAVVGEDFPEAYRAAYSRMGIDMAGLRTMPGRTFRWSGVYEADMIQRRTLLTELNVLETFEPRVPESYRDAPFLLLGNLTPDIQLSVLDQMRAAPFVVADTMDLWINIARDALERVIGRVQMLMLNDSEARLLTGRHGLIQCARAILDMGPEYVVIKKGEHGAMLVSGSEIFLLPAYPVEQVRDPTGAGDCFAGGFLGALASSGSAGGLRVRESLMRGAVVASFAVEDFSLGRLEPLSEEEIDGRFNQLRRMVSLEG